VPAAAWLGKGSNMAKSLPLDAAISTENLRLGQDEWFNVQEPVRYALDVIIAHLQDNQQVVRKLDSLVSGLGRQGQGYASSQSLDALRQQMLDGQGALGSRVARLEGSVGEMGSGLGQQIKRLEEQVGRDITKLKGQTESQLGALAGQLEELRVRLQEEAERGRRIESGLAAAAAAAEDLRKRMESSLDQGHWEEMGNLLESRLAGQDANVEALSRRLDSGLADGAARVEDLARHVDSGLASSGAQMADMAAGRQRLEDRLEAAMVSVRERADKAMAQAGDLDRKLSSGMRDLRDEIKTAADAALKDAADDCEGKCKEAERRAAQAVGAQVDAASQSAAREAAELRRRIKDLERDKVDKASMHKFTSEILDAFEQAGGASAQELEEKWGAELATLRTEMETKIASRALWQDLQSTAGRLDEAQEAINMLRLAVDQMEREAMQARAGLCSKEEARGLAQELLRQWDRDRDPTATNAAVAKAQDTAMAALDGLRAEAENLADLKDKLRVLEDVLFGMHGSPGWGSVSSPSLAGLLQASSNTSPRAPGGSREDGALRRLEALEGVVDKMAGDLGRVAAECSHVAANVREKADQKAVDALSISVAQNADGIEDLSKETYSRTDEIAKALSSLHKVLNASLSDRLSPGAVQAMIAEVAAALRSEIDGKFSQMMEHTHIVEHQERVLMREDGTRTVVESGDLSGVKIVESGDQGQSRELWQRVARLDGALESIRQRLEMQEARSPLRHMASPSTPQPDVGGLKHRLEKLESSQEAAAGELRAMARAVETAKRAAEHTARSSPQQATPELSRHTDNQWQAVLERLGRKLDDKVGREELQEQLRDLERRVAHEASRAARLGGGTAQRGDRPLSSPGRPGAHTDLPTSTEAKLWAAINGKADKQALEDMVRSVRGALDAKPSYAEMQAALKEKLDTRTFLLSTAGQAGGSQPAATFSSPPPPSQRQQQPASASARAPSSAPGLGQGLALGGYSPSSSASRPATGLSHRPTHSHGGAPSALHSSSLRSTMEERARAIFNATSPESSR